MKRALIVLLMLAVAGGLFAQVTYSGGVESGILAAFDEDGHYFYTSKADGGDKYSYSFGVDYAAPSGNVGGNLAVAGNDANEKGWNFDGSKLWFKPLDILTLSGGSGGQEGFNTPGPMDTSNDANNMVGLNLKLEPIPGLALGASVGPQNGLEFGDANYAFGVKFDATNLLTVVANLGLLGATADSVDDEGELVPGDASKVNAAAGVSVSALSNIAGLVIAADLAAENVAKLSDAGKVTAGLSVGFGVADLAATLKGKVALPMVDGDELNALLGADLSYPVGSATVGLGVGYLLSGAVGAGGKFNPGMWEAMDVDPVKLDSSKLKINPSVSFKVSEADLKIGYGLEANVGGESKMNHEIYTGFSIGF